MGRGSNPEEYESYQCNNSQPVSRLQPVIQDREININIHVEREQHLPEILKRNYRGLR